AGRRPRGCGGGSSWVAVMLARSGVALRHLIDVDYKVQFVARALHATASSVQVDPRVELWRGVQTVRSSFRVR
ncbi:hypothetical protein BGW80DRAFT_1320434, partial [Lactifluus volemus]